LRSKRAERVDITGDYRPTPCSRNGRKDTLGAGIARGSRDQAPVSSVSRRKGFASSSATTSGRSRVVIHSTGESSRDDAPTSIDLLRLRGGVVVFRSVARVPRSSPLFSSRESRIIRRQSGIVGKRSRVTWRESGVLRRGLFPVSSEPRLACISTERPRIDEMLASSV
jgi:hypothetical protein